MGGVRRGTAHASAGRLTGLRQSSGSVFFGQAPSRPSLRAVPFGSVGSISLASAVRRQGQPAQGIVPVGKALPTPRQPQQGSPRMMDQLARGAEDQKPQTPVSYTHLRAHETD